MPFFIFLGVLGALLAAGGIGFLVIRNKVRKYSKKMFGTVDLKKAARDIEYDVTHTPKSVSSMTSVALPQILRDFPDFNYDEMKRQAEAVVCSYLRAIDRNDPSELKYAGEELTDSLTGYIEALRNEEVRENYDEIKIHRTEIAGYNKRNGRCIVTYQTALQCKHYVLNDEGKVIRGDNEHLYQTKFNTELIYVQDRNKIKSTYDYALGVNCPNCGAVISTLGQKHCEYCGTAIVELNIKAWTWVSVEEIKSASAAHH